MALLGRKKVILAKNKDLTNLPSDINGIVYIEYSKGLGNWRNQLLYELDLLIKKR